MFAGTPVPRAGFHIGDGSQRIRLSPRRITNRGARLAARAEQLAKEGARRGRRRDEGDTEPVADQRRGGRVVGHLERHLPVDARGGERPVDDRPGAPADGEVDERLARELDGVARVAVDPPLDWRILVATSATRRSSATARAFLGELLSPRS